MNVQSWVKNQQNRKTTNTLQKSAERKPQIRHGAETSLLCYTGMSSGLWVQYFCVGDAIRLLGLSVAAAGPSSWSHLCCYQESSITLPEAARSVTAATARTPALHSQSSKHRELGFVLQVLQIPSLSRSLWFCCRAHWAAAVPCLVVWRTPAVIIIYQTRF